MNPNYGKLSRNDSNLDGNQVVMSKERGWGERIIKYILYYCVNKVKDKKLTAHRIKIVALVLGNIPAILWNQGIFFIPNII